MDDISRDDRFSHIARDPRFRSMSKRQKKVKIDKRFKTMFSDNRFQVKYSVDKRGRPVQFTSSENLKKYYDLSDSGSDSDSSESFEGTDEEGELIAKLTKKAKSKSKKSETCNGNEKVNVEKPESDSVVSKKAKSKLVCAEKKQNGKLKSEKKKKHLSDVGESDEAEDDDDAENLDSDTSDQYKDDVGNNMKEDESDDENDDDESDDGESDDDESDDGSNEKRVGGSPKVGADEPDYARGEGFLESSTDDDEDDDDDNKDDGLDHNWGELDKGVPQTEDLSCRLAVCNMDWDRIKAQDLFIVLNSFKPAGGVMKSIRIYPSEFGLRRIKEEEVSGPTELKGLAKEVDVAAGGDGESEDEDKDGNRYHREKLRQYQLNRLKYFYAVVECDSIKTANKIYEECDGMEYETTSAKIDLRFIPDEMTFDGTVKSECLGLPDMSNYKVSSFLTSALCQSKVDLTWDEDDQDRIKMTMRKFDRKGELNEDDFKAYLASESEDDRPAYGDLINQSDNSSDDASSSNEERQIEKYKNLLKGLDDSSDRKGDMDMEISWEPGLKDTAEDLVKTKEKTKGQTPWNEYVQRKKDKKKQRREEIKKKRQMQKEGGNEQAFSDDELPGGVDLTDSFFADELGGKSKKKKEKKKRKRKELTEEEEEIDKKEKAELELLMMDADDDGKDHFNLRDLVEKKKKKRKMKIEGTEEKSDNFEVDMQDSRFDAVFKSHLFNIDPSAPEFKKTKGMEAIIHEKLKRRKTDGQSCEQNRKLERSHGDDKDSSVTMATTSPQVKESLSSLVKSVKSKTQQFQNKKKLKKK